MLSVGSVSRRQLTPDGFQAANASWFGDGRRILLAGTKQGEDSRTWIFDLDNNSLEPISERGISGGLVSPQGDWFLARGPATAQGPRPHRLHAVNGSGVRDIPGLTVADAPIRWDAGGRHIYVLRYRQAPATHVATVFRIDVDNGRREELERFQPEFYTNALTLPVAVAPDGSAIAYTYLESAGALHVAHGVI